MTGAPAEASSCAVCGAPLIDIIDAQAPPAQNI